MTIEDAALELARARRLFDENPEQYQNTVRKVEKNLGPLKCSQSIDLADDLLDFLRKEAKDIIK